MWDTNRQLRRNRWLIFTSPTVNSMTTHMNVLSIDVNTRKKNLIITGIAESPNETSQTLISSLYGIFIHYIDTLEEEDFDLAFRLGLTIRNRKNPRPILVKMHRESVRNSINQVRFDLEDESAKQEHVCQ